MEAFEIIQKIESELEELKSICGTPHPPQKKSLAEVAHWAWREARGDEWDRVAQAAREYLLGEEKLKGVQDILNDWTYISQDNRAHRILEHLRNDRS